MMSFLGSLKKMAVPIRRIFLPSKIGFQFNLFGTQQRLQSVCSFVPIHYKAGLLGSSLVNSIKPTNLMNHQQVRTELTLLELHRRGPKVKKRAKKRPLDGNPQMKGVVIRTLTKKPKKPNSANRKCVLVRLTNGKEKIAYVPGEGNTLQEHNIVLVRVGRLQDVPGVKLKVIRGKYDCGHVIKTTKKL